MKKDVRSIEMNKEKGDYIMTVINYNEVPTYKIKQLIDLAGFNVITTEKGVHLYDKTNMDYADLSFKNLKEAVKVINPYLQRIKFKIIL